MTPSVSTFCERLAQLLLSGSWDAVFSLLAPWMQSECTPGDVRAFFEDDYRDALTDAGIRELHFPQQYRISGNDTALSELRTPVVPTAPPPPISVLVTPDNFRRWARIQLQCSEAQADEFGFDYFSEVWLIVSEYDGRLRVGYWTHDPYSFRPWNAPCTPPSQ